jgi:hypothetical protein
VLWAALLPALARLPGCAGLRPPSRTVEERVATFAAVIGSASQGLSVPSNGGRAAPVSGAIAGAELLRAQVRIWWSRQPWVAAFHTSSAISDGDPSVMSSRDAVVAAPGYVVPPAGRTHAHAQLGVE